MSLKKVMRRFWRFLERENLHRLLIIIVVLLVFGSVSITFLEPNISYIGGLWWTIVTLTTVGYGDIAPTTMGGRVVATMMMFFGIGLLGLFSATIAGVMVDKKIKEDMGMNSFKFKDHIILFEWNHRAKVILNELRTDPETIDTPIVVIANIDRKPVNDEELYFIKGEVTDEILQRANLAQAKTALVLGDDTLDNVPRDAKAVLITLAIESINPNVYTIVELADEFNIQHCKRANADEVIVSNDLSSSLMARATLNHGITKVVSEIIRAGEGHELYKVPLPATMVGQPFIEAFLEMKKSYQSIVLAVQQGRQGSVITNPPDDYMLAEQDYLIIVAEDAPQF